MYYLQPGSDSFRSHSAVWNIYLVQPLKQRFEYLWPFGAINIFSNDLKICRAFLQIHVAISSGFFKEYFIWRDRIGSNGSFMKARHPADTNRHVWIELIIN